jgi:PKD repeat protein
MNFRVFVRDNSITGGCNDHADVTLFVDANSGPFVLNYPSASGISWAASSTETILWDVANTDNSPVNCSIVDIMLSSDGGLTYPIVVASGVANDGSENITVPNNITTSARIRIMSGNGTFYDISDNNFEITAANNMVANFISNNTAICAGGSIDFTDASAGNPISWSWVFNGGNPAISSDQNPVGIQYASSGIYDVELTVSDGVNVNTIAETSYINVNANPIVIAGASALNAVTGESIDFNNLGSNGNSYTWDFGDGANSTLSSPSHAYSTAGSFTVILTGNLGNCSDSDTIIINVGVNDILHLESVSEFTIYPNPVNDNLTIEFIKPNEYEELKIMDNIGKVVFQKKLSSVSVENIDMRPYSSGLYSFMLSGGQKNRVVKVFKK